MNELITYSNGLRLVVAENPAIRSVAIGFWVGAGSARETAANNGISHFTEHVMFKGTETMTSFDVANSFESIGALVNAFTGKEGTCYYVKSIDEYAEKSFAVLADIFTHSSFDAAELDKERKVIIEEINMGEDSPEDICYDLLSAAIHGEKALGRPILGPIENVNRFNRYDVIDYMDKFYNADNIVVSVAGNINAETADKFVRKYLLHELRTGATPVYDRTPVDSVSRATVRIKDFEQSNIGIAFPSLSFNHPLSSVQSVVSIIFGGGMSSRLFQRIREQMGLAYSVYTAPLTYVPCGNFSIMLNITASNTQKVLSAVKKEIDEIVSSGVTREEFERAKIQLKSALVFAEESIQNKMTSQGKLMLFAGERYDVDKRIAEIDAVTEQAVNSFIKRTFDYDNICTAYVGKEPGVDVMKALKE